MWARMVAAFISVTFLCMGQVRAEEPARKDINKAELRDLTQVKGIGDKTAKKILDKRAELGKFTSMYQLNDVEGIGEVTLNKFICVFFVPEEGNLQCKIEGDVLKDGGKKGGEGKKGDAAAGGLVNLNTATKKELDTLPNIGDKKAQQIVDYRTQKGWFKAPQQLDEIDGFGKKIVEGLLDKVECKLDVNQARAAQFEALGFKNGDKIIEARQKAGGFKSIEEFAKCPDVDAKVFETTKDILEVRAK
jgi:competence protein ComEA